MLSEKSQSQKASFRYDSIYIESLKWQNYSEGDYYGLDMRWFPKAHV